MTDFKYIQEIIDSSKVVLFMKGNPSQPACGFSAAVVQILGTYDGLEYKAVNILDDDELRSDLKEFSNWPTFPQLYVSGNLIGGADIVREMFVDGELDDLFA